MSLVPKYWTCDNLFRPGDLLPVTFEVYGRVHQIETHMVKRYVLDIAPDLQVQPKDIQKLQAQIDEKSEAEEEEEEEKPVKYDAALVSCLEHFRPLPYDPRDLYPQYQEELFRTDQTSSSLSTILQPKPKVYVAARGKLPPEVANNRWMWFRFRLQLRVSEVSGTREFQITHWSWQPPQCLKDFLTFCTMSEDKLFPLMFEAKEDEKIEEVYRPAFLQRRKTFLDTIRTLALETVPHSVSGLLQELDIIGSAYEKKEYSCLDAASRKIAIRKMETYCDATNLFPTLFLDAVFHDVKQGLGWTVNQLRLQSQFQNWWKPWERFPCPWEPSQLLPSLVLQQPEATRALLTTFLQLHQEWIFHIPTVLFATILSSKTDFQSLLSPSHLPLFHVQPIPLRTPQPSLWWHQEHNSIHYPLLHPLLRFPRVFCSFPKRSDTFPADFYSRLFWIPQAVSATELAQSNIRNWVWTHVSDAEVYYLSKLSNQCCVTLPPNEKHALTIMETLTELGIVTSNSDLVLRCKAQTTLAQLYLKRYAQQQEEEEEEEQVVVIDDETNELGKRKLHAEDEGIHTKPKTTVLVHGIGNQHIALSSDSAPLHGNFVFCPITWRRNCYQVHRVNGLWNLRRRYPESFAIAPRAALDDTALVHNESLLLSHAFLENPSPYVLKEDQETFVCVESKHDYSSPEEFQAWKQQFPDLLLLTRSFEESRSWNKKWNKAAHPWPSRTPVLVWPLDEQLARSNTKLCAQSYTTTGRNLFLQQHVDDDDEQDELSRGRPFLGVVVEKTSETHYRIARFCDHSKIVRCRVSQLELAYAVPHFVLDAEVLGAPRSISCLGWLLGESVAPTTVWEKFKKEHENCSAFLASLLFLVSKQFVCFGKLSELQTIAEVENSFCNECLHI